MPIDLAMLATTVVSSFLLPYAKMGAEKLAEKLTGEASEAAARHVSEIAKKAWERVKAAFGSEKEQKTLELFKADPETFETAVKTLLRQKLEEDRQLAQELDKLVNARSPDGSGTGAQIMHANIGVILDLRGADFSHSRGATIVGLNQGGGTPAPPRRGEDDDPDEKSA